MRADSQPPRASRLLSRARCLYDEHANGLAAAAATAGRAGFAGGAEWMRLALEVIRGRRPDGVAAFHRLGFAKYAIAVVAAATVVALPALWWPWAWLLAIPAFYAFECRMVFAFPCALDGSVRPLRDSHAMVMAATSALSATLTVMRIAVEMLVGGVIGRGVVRSWCVGCLAVVLWYEEARR